MQPCQKIDFVSRSPAGCPASLSLPIVNFIFRSGLFLLAFVLAVPAAETRPPNIVIIFCDDLGYADIGPFGAKTKTPNLDRMAKEGMKFTDFYVGQAVCSASRAALLTGCYPNRVGILGALGPDSKNALHPNEITIAEMLKPRGYSTALFGKWHLGSKPGFLPQNSGFDEYYGLPYSNDMWPKHPTGKYPDLPLYDGTNVVGLNPDQSRFTTDYTTHAVQFIKRHRDSPFFLYLAHNMPHVPLSVSGKYAGKSQRGLYSDVIMEIDWSVGEVLKALKKNKVDGNTLVVFTSDNGPWLLYGNHAGRAEPLREGKATTFDGGQRVPCLMRWPGKIPRGSKSSEVACTMDLLPTIAALTGAKVPSDRIIDGRNIWPLMTGEKGARSPHDAFFYYWGGELQAVRSGPWKLHAPHSFPRPEPAGGDGQPGKYATRQIGGELFDLAKDPGETANLATQHPEVVRRLEALMEQCREDLGDTRTKQVGRNVRPAALVESATKPNP